MYDDEDDVLGCMDESDIAEDMAGDLDVGALPSISSLGLGGIVRPGVRTAAPSTIVRAAAAPARPTVRVVSPATAPKLQAAAHEIAARSLANKIAGRMPSAAVLQAARQRVTVPGISEAVALLRRAQDQRDATSEHRGLMSRDAWERDVRARLSRIEDLVNQSGERTLLRIVAGRKKAR